MSSDNKKKALFICLGNDFDASKEIRIEFILLISSAGNICRSPIAEAVFIDEVKKAGIADDWEIDSAAIGSWHVGRNPDSRALATMKKHHLAYNNKARQVSAPLQFSKIVVWNKIDFIIHLLH